MPSILLSEARAFLVGFFSSLVLIYFYFLSWSVDFKG